MNAIRAALDSLVASDLPPLWKGFFVTAGVIFIAVGFGAVWAALGHALRALPPMERKR